MKSVFNLSFRYKIPLWGSLLIVIATVAVSGSLMAQAYNDLRADLIHSSASLGRTIARTTFRAMLHDDVWQAFRYVTAPFHESSSEAKVIRPETIVVLDNTQQVFVSSHPRMVPMLSDYGQLGPDQTEIVKRIRDAPPGSMDLIAFVGERSLYVATPVEHQRFKLGTLIVVHSKDEFLPRFWALAERGALIGGLVLAILLPISWYWGQRTAGPLAQLACRVDEVTRGRLEEPSPESYPYRDELGRLFSAFALMVKALREKVLLEREMVRSERLAAVGRLASGIAHEINNPLGGMLAALDNFKQRGAHDARTLKTAAMIERGLMQIHETVRAMLVEAKVKSRDLVRQDVTDVLTLLSAESNQHSVIIDMDNLIRQPVSLPATPVRQILMNLLLNAIQAAEPGSRVRCRVMLASSRLRIETENSGRPIPPEAMDRLFEPFAHASETGHGLGLWVTYQIVSQLGGRITADSAEGTTRFLVVLPVEETHELTSPEDLPYRG